MTSRSVTLAIGVTVVCAAFCARTSIGQSPAKHEYEFVPDTDRKFAFYRNGFVMVGKLDARGNFIQENRYPSQDIPDGLGCTPVRYTESTKVYEFRSGRLMKGEMLPTGVFVPEAGSRITAFSDYHYCRGALPIWNLPGYFKNVQTSTRGKDNKE